MSNPILLIENAGYGTTPECPQAKFKRADICKYRKQEVVISVVVPPGHPAEYAMADARGEPRPLMITEPKPGITYVCALDGDLRGHLIPERMLKPTGKRHDGPIFEGDPSPTPDTTKER